MASRRFTVALVAALSVAFQLVDPARAVASSAPNRVQLVTTTSLPGARQADVHRFLATPSNWPDIVLSSVAVEGEDVSRPMQPGSSIDEIFGLPPVLPLSVPWKCSETSADGSLLQVDSPAGLEGVASNCQMLFRLADDGQATTVELTMSYDANTPLAWLAQPALVVDNWIALNLNLRRAFQPPNPSLSFGGIGGTAALAKQRSALKQELLTLAGPTKFGSIELTPGGQARLDELVEELAGLNPTAEPARSPLFSNEWRCLWTTEKEIRGVASAGLLGLPCVDVLQTTDVSAASLVNAIVFAEDSCLSVRSTLEPDSHDPSKFNFAFSSCSLKFRGYKLPLPPVGRGWGKIRYLDDDLRIDDNSRGDRLICVPVA